MDDMHDTGGYVRVERALTVHAIWHHRDPAYFFLFQLLIARAHYSGPKRGSLTVAAHTLATLMPAHFKMTRDRIRGMLLTLERWDMITTYAASKKAGTTICVTNYGQYQADPRKIEFDKLKAVINSQKILQRKACVKKCVSNTGESAPAIDIDALNLALDVAAKEASKEVSTHYFPNKSESSRNDSRKENDADSFIVEGFDPFDEQNSRNI